MSKISTNIPGNVKSRINFFLIQYWTRIKNTDGIRLNINRSHFDPHIWQKKESLHVLFQNHIHKNESPLIVNLQTSGLSFSSVMKVTYGFPSTSAAFSSSLFHSSLLSNKTLLSASFQPCHSYCIQESRAIACCFSEIQGELEPSFEPRSCVTLERQYQADFKSAFLEEDSCRALGKWHPYLVEKECYSCLLKQRALNSIQGKI